jgi:hypothetical protein
VSDKELDPFVRAAYKLRTESYGAIRTQIQTRAEQAAFRSLAEKLLLA